VSRTESDSWDLASSVGATATMVAAARALASEEPNPLINDPYAAPLVRAVGIDFFTKMVDGTITTSDSDDGGVARTMTDVMAVRTRFFDDFFTDSGIAGVRQAVILASGLDSRAYRLNWPAGTVVFEIDQPNVIEAKTATMTEIGAVPTADRRAVAVDLRDDWAAALTAAGFDTSLPTAWSAEGLLVYLPPEAQDRLFDQITALSAPGSRLATEFHPDGSVLSGDRVSALTETWRDQGFDVHLPDLIYDGERASVVDYLTGQGWDVSARLRPDVFADYGRVFPESELLAHLRNSKSIIATLN
jgi:methyltransferase (TIGR00027 family)